MSRRPVGRAVTIPAIRPVPGYAWAASVLPADWVSVGDVASALGLGRHQARRLIIAARIPTRMVRRSWYGHATGRPFSWRCLGVPAGALQVLLMIRMKKILQRFPDAPAVPAKWRQRAWRARLSWTKRSNSTTAPGFTTRFTRAKTGSTQVHNRGETAS